MPLKSYHYAWLSAHPNKTEEWLIDRIKDGFHVHHIDADTDNNDPSNLVLIDGADHMRLHGLDGILAYALSDAKERKRSVRNETNRKCYQMRRYQNITWASIEDALCVRGANARAMTFAKENNLPWPLPINQASHKAKGQPARMAAARKP